MKIMSAKQRKKITKRWKLLKSLYRNRNRFGKAVYSVMYLWQQNGNKKR